MLGRKRFTDPCADRRLCLPIEKKESRYSSSSKRHSGSVRPYLAPFQTPHVSSLLLCLRESAFFPRAFGKHKVRRQTDVQLIPHANLLMLLS